VKKFEGILLVKENEEYFKPMWCLIENKKMFKIRGEIFRLDILDTSGNDPFPAIKKLNIMTGIFY
jgi:hypothetical protein